MADYVQPGDVRMWYDEHGEGDPLVLLVEKPDLCNRIILDFLSAEPVQTMAPIRRAAGRACQPGPGPGG